MSDCFKHQTVALTGAALLVGLALMSTSYVVFRLLDYQYLQLEERAKHEVSYDVALE